VQAGRIQSVRVEGGGERPGWKGGGQPTHANTPPTMSRQLVKAGLKLSKLKLSSLNRGRSTASAAAAVAAAGGWG